MLSHLPPDFQEFLPPRHRHSQRSDVQLEALEFSHDTIRHLFDAVRQGCQTLQVSLCHGRILDSLLALFSLFGDQGPVLVELLRDVQGSVLRPSAATRLHGALAALRSLGHELPQLRDERGDARREACVRAQRPELGLEDRQARLRLLRALAALAEGLRVGSVNGPLWAGQRQLLRHALELPLKEGLPACEHLELLAVVRPASGLLLHGLAYRTKLPVPFPQMLLSHLEECAQRLLLLLLGSHFGVDLMSVLEGLVHPVRHVREALVQDGDGLIGGPGLRAYRGEGAVPGVELLDGSSTLRGLTLQSLQALPDSLQALVHIILQRCPLLDLRFEAREALAHVPLPLVRRGLRDARPGCQALHLLLQLAEALPHLLLELPPPGPEALVQLVRAANRRLHLIGEALEVPSEFRQAPVELRLQPLRGRHLLLEPREGHVPQSAALLLLSQAGDLSMHPLLKCINVLADHAQNGTLTSSPVAAPCTT
mmetsp:Transcript_97205/g.270502  ORF Transcript_97205/g.270502 Transcript_97205/m.270502 type:complete len:483 (-) Transcript_97205:295-1743(-)